MALLILLASILGFGCAKERYTPVKAAEYARKSYIAEWSDKKAVDGFNKAFKQEGYSIDYSRTLPGYNPDWGSAMFKYDEGIIEHLKGNNEKALECFRASLAELNSYGEMQTRIKRLKAVKEGLPGPIYFYGMYPSFKALGEKDSAKFYLEKAEESSRTINDKEGLALCLEEKGDIIMQSNSTGARIFYQGALTYINRKDFAGRVRLYEKITQTFPQGSDSLYYYDNLLQKSNEELRKECEKRGCPVPKNSRMRLGK